MRNKILWIVLVLVVIVVAALSLSKRANMTEDLNGQVNDSSSVTTTDSRNDQPQGDKPSLPSSLNEDEKAALSASMGGSKVESDQQMALAMKAAKEASSVEVEGCELSPAVLKVKFQTKFSLKNSGDDEVVVMFYADNVSRSVPAGDSVSVEADFGKSGSGLFGYYCTSNGVVRPGLLLMYNN